MRRGGNSVAASALFRVSTTTDLAKDALGRDEYGHGVRIVLGLRDKIGSDGRRIAGFAGDDDFGGSGQHVDGAIESDQLLRGL